VTIPANTSATVVFPPGPASGIRESGLPAQHAPGVTFLRMEGASPAFRIESGAYRFSLSGPHS
jgi:hypothetical protein